MIELEKYKGALIQVINDCDEWGMDWHNIAKEYGDENILNECIEEHGYIKGIAEYYLKTIYTLEAFK